MILDHIGILVPHLEPALLQWEKVFGYHQDSDIVLNHCQKVRVVFLSKADSLAVKLIEPSAPDSPVFQAARKGGGLHHLCFRCPSVVAQIPLLQDKGAMLLLPPQPGEAFNNHPIAFMLAGNLNFELIDTSEKQGWGANDLVVSAHGGSK
jgi:methylmalonyl-CoA/ethylmalonyl-CoA epimerase